ncbi:disease resistance protein RPV1-like [Syzygium oleosum]|uniref:disease resistance protein RPV1-like n=1 Tax=Syzygium oleosum TaxID=219896 RepID=UPI0024B904BC|nr:disease resistance protein RPV1-like [Syzygium oleosum]
MSKRPGPDMLEELFKLQSDECESKLPLLLPSLDSSEKINVPSASGANSDPSASSTSVVGNSYYVFLSFRGPDTRNSFVDHLYHRLKDVGLRFHPNFVFRDDENLPFGEDVAANLISAITHSKVSIPVISENYAASEWCLRELICIMDCQKSRGQTVLPVLYKVETKDVKYLQGSVKKAFESRKHWSDEAVKQQGREALKKAAASRVFESEKFAKGHEAELVNKLVEIVMHKRQEDFQPRLTVNLVGIVDRVAEVMKLADIAYPDTRIIWIWGIGGIGKTTLAMIIYNKLFDKFQCRSFLKDIRETISRKGIEHVQSRLISDILKIHNHQVHDPDTGINMIQASCTQKKVLILLDDVDNPDHLDNLIGGCNFLLGSRIIVTCRHTAIKCQDKAMLDSTYWYELQEMNSENSSLLFSIHAFEGKPPPKELATLSRDIVATTGGLPLALKVIGSLLKGKDNERVWREMLKQLSKAPNMTVQQKLMISYDALEHNEKQMFLDIACFLVGTNQRIATYLWDDLDFCPISGLARMIELSLIKVDDENKLRMHDQLRDLGRAIAHPAKKNPWDWSRLWNKEAMEVLRRKEQNEYIEALRLDKMGSREFMERESFKRMPNLKFLHVSDVDFVGDFKDSLSKLRWLKWKRCPDSFKATNVHLEKLIILNLSQGLISENWGGWSSIEMDRLKVLNLSWCSHLKSTPNLSAFKNLEMLILKHCKGLEEIDPSIGDVRSLVSLNLRYCKSLKKLPSQLGELKALKELMIGATAIKEIPPCIGSLKKLEMLDVSHTPDLSLDGFDYCFRHIPHSIGKLKSLTKLTLLRAEISKLPESIGDLENLKILNIACCKKMSSLPSTISKLGKLEELNVSFCQSLGGEVPIDGLSSLKILRLSDTRFSGFPDAIGKLSCLEELDLTDCSMIRSLPELPASLTYLTVTCDLCTLPQLSHLIHLKQLHFLECASLESIPELPSGLLKLYVSGCFKLTELPSLSSLELLSRLCIVACQELTEIKGLEGLKSLKHLDVSGCNKLSNLDGLEHLESLRYLGMQGLVRSRRKEWFKRLQPDGPQVNDDLFQGLDRLKNLEQLIIYRCQSLIRPDLSQLTRLKLLRAQVCNNLVEIKGLERLKNLESLYIDGCMSIETLPDLSCCDELELLSTVDCQKLRNVRCPEKVRWNR